VRLALLLAGWFEGAFDYHLRSCFRSRSRLPLPYSHGPLLPCSHLQTVINYSKHSTPSRFIAQRSFVSLVYWVVDPDGTIILGAEGVKHPDAPQENGQGRERKWGGGMWGLGVLLLELGDGPREVNLQGGGVGHLWAALGLWKGGAG
jgi:hypothetical protein